LPLQGVEIQGFPTLKMFVNNDKDEVLDYEGARDFDAIKVQYTQANRLAAAPRRIINGFVFPRDGLGVFFHAQGLIAFGPGPLRVCV
jgi:hypothetical protein